MHIIVLAFQPGNNLQKILRMKQGSPICRFELRFSAKKSAPLEQLETPEQIARRKNQQQLANLVLSILPHVEGITLVELQGVIQRQQVNPQFLRPSVLLESLRQLQHAGLAASTANQPGDDLTRRRYWRAPRTGN
jgi:hypothetical protein